MFGSAIAILNKLAPIVDSTDQIVFNINGCEINCIKFSNHGWLIWHHLVPREYKVIPNGYNLCPKCGKIYKLTEEKEHNKKCKFKIYDDFEFMMRLEDKYGFITNNIELVEKPVLSKEEIIQLYHILSEKNKKKEF